MWRQASDVSFCSVSRCKLPWPGRLGFRLIGTTAEPEGVFPIKMSAAGFGEKPSHDRHVNLMRLLFRYVCVCVRWMCESVEPLLDEQATCSSITLPCRNIETHYCTQKRGSDLDPVMQSTDFGLVQAPSCGRPVV